MSNDTLAFSLISIAKDAGDAILAHYRHSIDVAFKEDASPITAADYAAHQLILQRLHELTPDTPIISEESETTVAVEENSDFWLVDPLDGTKEFVKRSGEFTVNIALIRGGRPVLGVVRAPALGRNWWAVRDEGAFSSVDGTSAEQLHCRMPAASPLTVVASRDHLGEREQTLISGLGNIELSTIGSSLKFCLVAEGRADLYPRFVPTMEWDTAAAQLVVEEAGGVVLDLEGRALRYGKPEYRNPSIVTIGDPSIMNMLAVFL